MQDASVLRDKDFVAVQELFLTETTDHADVVFPAASFAEMDGTFTNNAGNVQRVRKAIEPLHQSKPDWMITSSCSRKSWASISATNGSRLGGFQKLVADAVPAYTGLRYPDLKDESNRFRSKHEIEAANETDAEKR